MTWDTLGDNTNITFVRLGLLNKYLSGSLDVYKCPADHFLSSAQRALGWKARVRSLSMNFSVGDAGRYSSGGISTIMGGNVKQFMKATDFRNPARIFVLLDEHPDSINDGYFCNDPNSAGGAWGDLPASYHNGACGLSFADGHSEIKKWQFPSTKLKVKTAGLGTMTIPANQSGDFRWLAERTSYSVK
jgi:prepilin-type processing-associated H-X9-DG protein